ncbi:MAG: hypothetical protein PF517_10805 [Salinivirgaceae bacterium]|jgi:hypothetical protein|nr:hypothetical protein [Salinivirgaceae bacterium]
MENQFSKVTKSSDYTDTCTADYKEYYQLHILSYSQIFSNYYKKTEFELDQVKSNSLNILDSIQKKTSFPIDASLYEKDGILLITDSDELINYTDLFDFNIQQGCYDYADHGMDLFEFIGEQPADTFVKNALTTVGAASLITVVEPFIPELLEEQASILEHYNNMRDEDKASPKYLVEIYKIEKDYLPKVTHEFKCASIESATSLPEIKSLVLNDERTTMLVKEIVSNEIVEGSLDEAIEGIKHAKWVRKHQALINAERREKMELDKDGPNFLSNENNADNTDVYEEGDDEYQPNF